MARASRLALLAAALLAFFCAAPAPARAAARDFATVGRIGVRIVDGRTVVLVPIAGPARLLLSEPFILARRARLVLTIENARLGVGRPAARRAEGLLALSIREASGDVVVMMEVARLGDYGLRPTDAGIVLWLDAERPAALANAPGGDDATGAMRVASAATRPAPESAAQDTGGSALGLLTLALVAGAAGWMVRRMRSAPLPAWAGELMQRSMRWVRPSKADQSGAEKNGQHAASGD